MTKEFNSLEEIEKYYDEETNTYVFKENNQFIDLVMFNFDLNVKADISAWNIKAYNIDALDIKANDIIAWNINACNINTWDIRSWNINAKNIKSHDINAKNIKSWDINAWDITTFNIEAENINYYAVCFAYNNIKCKTINGIKENAKHFVLDGKLEIEE